MYNNSYKYSHDKDNTQISFEYKKI